MLSMQRAGIHIADAVQGEGKATSGIETIMSTLIYSARSDAVTRKKCGPERLPMNEEHSKP
jgi:hypothetical protein